MNTAFVAAAGKLPESSTHSPACFTRGGCSGFGGRGGGGREQLGEGCLVVEKLSHHWQGKARVRRQRRVAVEKMSQAAKKGPVDF